MSNKNTADLITFVLGAFTGAAIVAAIWAASR
jgi:hypothetical protein